MGIPSHLKATCPTAPQPRERPCPRSLACRAPGKPCSQSRSPDTGRMHQGRAAPQSVSYRPGRMSTAGRPADPLPRDAGLHQGQLRGRPDDPGCGAGERHPWRGPGRGDRWRGSRAWDVSGPEWWCRGGVRACWGPSYGGVRSLTQDSPVGDTPRQVLADTGQLPLWLRCPLESSAPQRGNGLPGPRQGSLGAWGQAFGD